MMRFTLLYFMAFCCVVNSSREGRNIADLPDAASNRNLFSEKWPPKQDIPVRRYHQWTYSGAATASQYTNRAGHKAPKKSDDTDDHYYYYNEDDEENHYDEQADDDLYYFDAARPSEKKFEYYDKHPKKGKQYPEGKGRGKGGKRNKSDECEHYYYDDEQETYPGEDDDYYKADYYGKGTKGGKGIPEKDDDYHDVDYDGKGTHGGKGKGGGKGTHEGKGKIIGGKVGKADDKRKRCTEPPFESPPPFTPYPSTSNDVPSKSPISGPSVAPAPSAPSQFTPSPTDEDSIAVSLPMYALAYDVPNLRQPTQEELDALQVTTSLYLEIFFFEEFDGNTFTVLDDFITELLEASFVQGLPIEVDYLSTARFNPFSTIIPSETQVNSALIDAFSGLNMLDYEEFLNEELPDDNVFIGSTVVFLQEEDAGERQPDISRSKISVTGIAAAAVAFTLVVVGIVIYKRRHDGKEVETEKLNKAGGDVTVAGETYTAETYDGTTSVSAASMEYARRYQDDDEASKTISNLGTIPESGDIDSVTPAWDNTSGSEDEADNRQTFAARSPALQPSSSLRSGTSSFEEIALQGPTNGGFDQNFRLDNLSSLQDSSKESNNGFANLRSTMHFGYSLSDDSMDGRAPSLARSLSLRDHSSRRPRTVAEIEALLSADVGQGVDDDSAASIRSKESLPRRVNSRPRTVEEIESLLHAELDDDPNMEPPFSDEDETTNARDG